MEPARIDSLSDKQWDALRHALSPDREQQTPEIADFLRNFEIDGTEKLRRSEETPPATHPPKSLDSEPTPAVTTPAIAPGPIARNEDALELSRAKGKHARRLPSLILLVVLVALGAWYFYGQPRDDIVPLIDYVESSIAARSLPREDVRLVAIPSDLGQATSEKAEAEDNATTDAPPIVEVSPVEIPAEEPVVPADESLSNNEGAIGEEPEIETVDASLPPRTETTLIHSVTYVSERDGAARISTRHPGATTGQLFWWTGEQTAVAEYDFIPIEDPLEAFTSGEEAETVHIPLVNDSVPEPLETFYVFLGRFDAPTERLEPIMRIRVEINDDD
jgi:hypothetical protein